MKFSAVSRMPISMKDVVRAGRLRRLKKVLKTVLRVFPVLLAVLFIGMMVVVVSEAVDEPDPVARSTWFLVAATAGLAAATITLVFASIWQARFIVRSQERMEESRRADESAYRVRTFIDSKLSAHFTAAWQENLFREAQSKGTGHLIAVLKPFGIELSGVERCFPEFKSRLVVIRRSEYLKDLEANDPEEYERVIRKEMEEQDAAEQLSVDQYIEDEKIRRA